MECVEYVKANPDATRKQTLYYFTNYDGGYWQERFLEIHEEENEKLLEREKYLSGKVVP